MNKINPWLCLLIIALMLILPACGISPIPKKSATPAETSPSLPALGTATPTPTNLPAEDTPASPSSGVCPGLAGELEVQLELPYAAAVELDPTALGALPLDINPETLQVKGQGRISYDETQTWTDDEGKETAEVFLELGLDLEGLCVESAGGGELQLKLDVIHQEEQGSTTCAYPPGECSDSPVMGPQEQSFEFSLPLEDGAVAEREDWTTWTFTLHLTNQ